MTIVWVLAYVALMSAALIYVVYRWVEAERMARERADDAVKFVKVNHAACVAHMAHYVGDSFAAQVLRIAAEDFDSVEGQTKLREIGSQTFKIGGPSLVNLWLHDRADQFIEAHEEEDSDGQA